MSISVGRWQIGNRNISLFQEGNRLKYNVSKDDTSSTSTLSPDLIKLYGMPRSIKLIEIFHETIQENLKQHLSSQAFLPLLCTEGFIKKENDNKTQYEPINLQIALFGQFAPPNPEDTSRKIISARWGIYDPIGKKATYLDVDAKSGEALAFLKNVSFRSGEKNYSDYAKRFKAIVTKDDDMVTSVALRCMSIFDPSVVIDEQNWAITVLSAGNGSGHKSVGFSPNKGHSMIAIEGIKNGKTFIEYAHITTKKQPGFDDKRKETQARVEIIKNKIIYDVTSGITWSQSRTAVLKMLKHIERKQNNKRYVNFSMTGGAILGIYSMIQTPLSMGLLLTGNIVPAVSIALVGVLIGEEENCHSNDHDNCASWVIKMLKKAGIELVLEKRHDVFRPRFLMPESGQSITISPKHLVKAINSNKIKIEINEIGDDDVD